MESDKHLKLFRRYVPHGFLREMLVTVYDCYADAVDHCQSLFEKPEAVNMRPFHRRGLIEQALRKAAEKYSDVSATAERGIVGEDGQFGWWYHTLIRCGPIALTQNTVGSPSELVRPSLFRQIYAAANPQLLLFPREETDSVPKQELRPLPKGVRLYGILLHGQSDRATLPGFAEIRFPNREYDGYLPGSIDLFGEFPEVVAERTRLLTDDTVQADVVQTADVEHVEEPAPQLRVNRKAQGAST